MTVSFGDTRVPLRLWQRVAALPSGCWIWSGRLNRTGYGITTKTNSRTGTVVHRYVYQLTVGEIPDGLQLDHLCRVRTCCNPAHLEPVTQTENLLRGDTLTARAATTTHCPAGHPYSGINLRITPQGHRACRQCRREQEAGRRERGGDALKARQRVYVARSYAKAKLP